MLRRLPSMSGLRAFEATARHLSFTHAATELNLTQGAVSHQIKNLETILGLKLFVRDGNLIRLTEAGQEYLASARAALTEVLIATDRAIDRQRGDVLTIACLGTFAIKTLIPNLHDFMQRNPQIGLRTRTVVPLIAIDPQDYDVSIQYGTDGDWPGMVAHKIGGEELFPVCSPRIIKSGKALATPKDLARHTIIRTASPLILRDDWPRWLEEAGVPGLEFSAEITCDLLYPSYQAAIEGLGVTMGRSAVVRGDIASGRLVEPFAVRLPSSLGYYVVTGVERAKLAKVQLFYEWAADRLARAVRMPPPANAAKRSRPPQS